MSFNMPQVTESPTAMRAYSPPTSAPDNAASAVPIMLPSDRWNSCAVVPGEHHSAASNGSADGRPELRGRAVVWPDHDPRAVLDLLDPLCAWPEVVVVRVEGQLATECRLGAVFVQGVADLLMLETLGVLDTLDEDLPRVPRRRSLRLERGVRKTGSLRPRLELRDDRGGILAVLRCRRFARLEDGHRQQTLRCGAEPERRARCREEAEHHRRLVAQLAHRGEQVDRVDTDAVVDDEIGVGVADLGGDRRPVRRRRWVADLGNDLVAAILRDRHHARVAVVVW